MVCEGFVFVVFVVVGIGNDFVCVLGLLCGDFVVVVELVVIGVFCLIDVGMICIVDGMCRFFMVVVFGFDVKVSDCMNWF